jgi:alkane 1-monooxygenase
LALLNHTMKGSHRNYKYLLSVVPAILVITGNMLGSWWVAMNVVFSLGVLAILENFVPEDKDNSISETDWFPDALLMVHVINQVICLGTMGWSVYTFHYNPVQFTLLTLSTGINSGASAIVIAHELVHRKSKLMRSLGIFLLFSAVNIYFYIDHLKVHHKWVGTKRDPATARINENLYVFFIRSTFHQIRSSFNVEAKRLKDAGSSAWSMKNFVVASVCLQAALWFLLIALFGPLVLVAYLLQGFFANFLLEYTNYIEHYGLSRKDNERVTEMHSWQTDRVISRYFLIDLSRHADHHYYASKPYHTLKSHEKSPVLPGGYVSMIYYALVPPLFFRKLHPLMAIEN